MDYAIPLVATTALVFGAAAAVALIAMAALFTEELVVASAEVEAEGPAASPDRDRAGKWPSSGSKFLPSDRIGRLEKMWIKPSGRD